MAGWMATALAILIVICSASISSISAEMGTAGTDFRLILTGILIVAAGIAFYVGFRGNQFSIPNQAAMWSAAVAAAMVLATNLPYLAGRVTTATGPQAQQTKISKSNVKVKRRNTDRAGYQPDTPRLNKVENEVNADPENRFANARKKNSINQFTSTDTKLDDSWEPTTEQRQQFKRFLESQGIDYDPATAFKMPRAPQ